MRSFSSRPWCPMPNPIDIRYAVRPRTRSLLAGRVMDLFGLSPDEEPHVVAADFEIDLPPGAVALITGPSGSGKSSLLRALGERENALDLAALPLPDCPLIDALPGTLEERLSALAAAGLGEARLMLRTPAELSDGQRYRFLLAFGLAQSSKCLMLDEFGAVLDRTLAKVVAFNLRKVALRTGIGAICATTHEDLADDLNPDIHIRCHGDGMIGVEHREVKKNGSPSAANSGSRPVPAAIGRTSLGGITAATISLLPAA